MKDCYPVSLTEEQRAFLQAETKRGRGSARYFKRVWILLLCNEGKTYKEVSEAISASPTMIRNTRKKLFLEGLDAALNEKPRPGQPRKVTPEVEAKITALACEEPPLGRNHWTISLLKDELSERFTTTIGWGSIQRTLAGHEVKPWKKKCGVSPSSMPPSSNA